MPSRVAARLFALLAMALLCAIARDVEAHTVGLSRGVYEVSWPALSAKLAFSRSELALAINGLEDAPSEETAMALIADFVKNELSITTGGEPCTARKAHAVAAEQDGVAVTLSYACGANGDLRVSAAFIGHMASGHHHLAHVVFGEQLTDADLSRETPTLEIPLGPGAHLSRETKGQRAATFLRMGVWHILTGYDHLLFLIGLLLVLKPVRSLVGAVTAFTLAHSITLSLAVAGVWAPSPRWVEPAIALSILYVGLENWFVRTAVGRWRITFVFGLIHGFGFAGALREIALPNSEIPLALLTFNTGVELGQLALVAVVLPALFWAQRCGLLNEQRARLASLPVAAMGAFWLVTRLVGAS